MSAASSPVMPGAYRFSRKDLSISTNRPLSTFSTDTVFFSPTDEIASPSYTSFDADDDFKTELHAISQLGRDIRNNLALRPIPGLADTTSSTTAITNLTRRSLELEPPTSATSSVFSYTTAPSSPSVAVYSPSIYSPFPSATFPHSLGRNTSHPAFTASLPDIHNPQLPLNIPHTTPHSLATALASPCIPLILDTRPAAEFEQLHIRDSVNLAIPSLILKRCRKPGGGFQTLNSLRTFITTSNSQQAWDKMMSTTSPTLWNGDIIITDETMDETAHLTSTSNLSHISPSSTAWALLPALSTLVNGCTTYLRGGIAKARVSQDLKPYLVGHLFPHSPISSPTLTDPSADSALWSYLRPTSTTSPSAGEASPLTSHSKSRIPSGPGKDRVVSAEKDPNGKKAGLFSLNTDSSSRNRENMPIVDDRSSASAACPSSSYPQPPSQGSSRVGSVNSGTGSIGRRTALYDASPSPSPSASTFPRASRNRGMTLGIDTKSAERLRALSSSQPLVIPTSPSVQLKPPQPNLPKLHLRTLPPTKSSTLDVPPASPGAGPSGKSGRLRLPLSPHRPNLVVTICPTPGTSSDDDDLDKPHAATSVTSQLQSTNHGQSNPRSSSRSRSPGSSTRRRSTYLCSPRTARPDESPSFSREQDAPAMSPPPSPILVSPFSENSPISSESPDAPEVFTVSTILPSFLYLGPEMSAPEHVEEVRALGVRRVLNMAIECEDEHGYAQSFPRYHKIPMRDTVEEENVSKGVREVCQFLDDARLHSQPTYVHCKAGKSRSVTAVIAYLIHANHWSLVKAYDFVLDRRRGISPNIGFMGELMSFEEEELGRKGRGVAPPENLHQAQNIGTDATPMGDATSVPNDGCRISTTSESFMPGHGHSQSVVVGGGTTYARRAHHTRESLPPTFTHQPVSLADIHAKVDVSNHSPPESGDSVAHAQEVEIKDVDGRYRHARRAPVDELTLQPMRRASKAGLESSNQSLIDAS